MTRRMSVAVVALSLGGTLTVAGCTLVDASSDGSGLVVEGPGELVRQERDLGDFSRLEVDSSIDVTMSPGERPRAVVHAEESVIDHVVVSVTDDTLVVTQRGPRRVVGFVQQGVSVDLTVAEGTALEAIEVSDSSELDADGDLTAARFELTVVDSAEVSMAVTTDELVVDAADSSDVALTGAGGTAQVTATDSSDVQLRELTVGDAEVSANDSSDVTLAATGVLSVQAGQSSTVRYAVEPERLDVSTDGSSEVVSSTAD